MSIFGDLNISVHHSTLSSDRFMFNYFACRHDQHSQSSLFSFFFFSLEAFVRFLRLLLPVDTHQLHTYSFR